MKRKHLNGDTQTRIAHFIDLPPEAVFGSVGVHLIQDSYCTVENFLSMPVFSDRLVRLVCRNFDIALEGRNLSAKELSGGMLVLTGRICSVSYKRRGETEEE